MTVIAVDRRTALYRLYDEAGKLLYVGITYGPTVRFYQHATDKHWWPCVARKDVTWYDTRAKAGAAEAKAVIDESPLWNIATPDENGTYQTGAGRPPWEATTDAERAALDRIAEASAELRRVREQFRSDEGPVWEAIRRAVAADIPVSVISRRAKISKAAIYRRLGQKPE